MLKTGDGIVCMDDVYGGKAAVYDSHAEKYDATNACRFFFGWKEEDLFESFCGIFFLLARHEPLLSKSCL